MTVLRPVIGMTKDHTPDIFSWWVGVGFLGIKEKFVGKIGTLSLYQPLRHTWTIKKQRNWLETQCTTHAPNTFTRVVTLWEKPCLQKRSRWSILQQWTKELSRLRHWSGLYDFMIKFWIRMDITLRGGKKSFAFCELLLISLRLCL